jgi:hypothetical protein
MQNTRLKKLGAALTGLASAVSLHGYYLNLRDQHLITVLEDYRISNLEKAKELTKAAENAALSEQQKAELIIDAVKELRKLENLVENLKAKDVQSIKNLIENSSADNVRDVLTSRSSD